MPEARLHHVGYVVADLAASLPEWAASLGASQVSEIFTDPLQRVQVAFLEAGGRIELVAPLGENSPVAAFLAKGGGMHHLCYEVDDLDAHIAEMKRRRAVLIRPAKPAAAFGGRRIAWMVTRERLVIEYLESTWA